MNSMAAGGKQSNNLYYLYVVIVCLLLAVIIWIFFYKKLRQTDQMIIDTREKQTAFARNTVAGNAGAIARSADRFNCSLLFLQE